MIQLHSHILHACTNKDIVLIVTFLMNGDSFRNKMEENWIIGNIARTESVLIGIRPKWISHLIDVFFFLRKTSTTLHTVRKSVYLIQALSISDRFFTRLKLVQSCIILIIMLLRGSFHSLG